MRALYLAPALSPCLTHCQRVALLLKLWKKTPLISYMSFFTTSITLTFKLFYRHLVECDWLVGSENFNSYIYIFSPLKKIVFGVALQRRWPLPVQPLKKKKKNWGKLNQPHASPTMNLFSFASLELWPRKYGCGWDSLVSPDPLFGEHWSRAHLYSALALYSYCQWPVPRLLKMDEAKAQPNNQSIPPGWV